ncbi:MAG TPA: GTPase HflX [Firmicutes bacterium]|nr:GTPase HflX [Bacillota bacterium]
MLETAILVGLEQDNQADVFDQAMEELSLLTQTAGAEPLLTVRQKRPSPDPRYFIGRGKTREIASLAKELGATLVIFNDQLSPSQIRNLEKVLAVKVIDRTALILDIFACRARTRAGKLQVELAQLQYLLPRLTGLGTQLSRLGGGIGTRGPGETRLEVDRRRIRLRISELRREIRNLKKQRLLHRRLRKKRKMIVISLVGYTNAGKSTLLNTLTGAGLYTEDKLFATLDPSVRRGTIAGGKPVLFSDTVGFIRRLPSELWTAFQATLEELGDSNLLLHVVDLSHPDYLNQLYTVREHLARLDSEYYQREVLVFNKLDAVTGRFNRDLLQREFPGASFISALTGEGVENLKQVLLDEITKSYLKVRLYLPYSDQPSYFQVLREGTILDEKYHPRYIEVLAELSPSLGERFSCYTVPPAGATRSSPSEEAF